MRKFITVFIFIIGIGLLLYPVISDHWNSMQQSEAVLKYDRNLGKMDDETYERILQQAMAYNEELAHDRKPGQSYDEVLNITGNGIMGYITIPKIDVQLPIYHGTSEAVLQEGVGHLEGTSLPVGGTSAHAVLSSHRGLPSARLFTDLDQLEMGDRFQITVLKQVITYEVDQIVVVEPHEVDALQIEKDHDYCTLVTCTPYGINTHRMLVRGHRIETTVEERVWRISSDAIILDLKVLCICIWLVEVSMAGCLVWKRFRGRRDEKHRVQRRFRRRLMLLWILYSIFMAAGAVPEVQAQEAEWQGTLIVQMQHDGQELLLQNAETGQQWSQKADEEGIVCFTNLPDGVYQVEMAEQDDGVRMQSFRLEIPYNHTEYVIHAMPKFADPQGGEQNIQKPTEQEQVLPGTGLLRWPVPILIISGCVCIWLGRDKKEKVDYGNGEQRAVF